MPKKLTNSQKISEKLNKLIKKIYCDYRSKVMHMYTNPGIVFVGGNSAAYAETIVIPALYRSKYGVFIFTRVDENNNLIGTYIIPVWAFNEKNTAWVSKKYVQSIGINPIWDINKIMYFNQFRYEDFEQFNDQTLLNLVNNYRNSNNK